MQEVGDDFQRYLVGGILNDSVFLKLCKRYIKPSYFTQVPHQVSVRYAFDYFDQHGSTPEVFLLLEHVQKAFGKDSVKELAKLEIYNCREYFVPNVESYDAMVAKIENFGTYARLMSVCFGFIDNHQVDLDEAVAQIKSIKHELNAASESADKRYELHEDLIQTPAISYLIQDHYVEKGLAYMLAQSGTGKSLMAIDQSLCVATGQPYLGTFDVNRGAVVYVGQDGAEDFKYRVNAWYLHHGIEPTDYFCRISEDFDLTTDAQTNELISIIEADDVLTDGTELKLVVVDTLFNMLGGQNENSPGVMGAALANELKIMRHFDCGLLNLSHPGHNAPDRPRGHSCQKGKLNSIHVLPGGVDRGIHVRNTKNKSGTETKPYYVDLCKADSGLLDAQGEPFFTLVAKDNPRWKKALNKIEDDAAKVAAVIKPMAAPSSDDDELLTKLRSLLPESEEDGVDAETLRKLLTVRKQAVVDTRKTIDGLQSRTLAKNRKVYWLAV